MPYTASGNGRQQTAVAGIGRAPYFNVSKNAATLMSYCELRLSAISRRKGNQFQFLCLSFKFRVVARVQATQPQDQEDLDYCEPGWPNLFYGFYGEAMVL
jgi:hypothetical protein